MFNVHQACCKNCWTGADWCWIDAERVAWSPTQLMECIQIIIHASAGKMIHVVRVPNKTAFDYMCGV
ncbi:hypothetical protein B0H17DRAFT_81901 [Mycena rosella]|uniref:Uncharacterized protein n=1 Tax=Mycena rosella TaxID=1033263 RepID=A0AAD7GNK2_MYCRO|nr:hypothetical protein B0H17DRAFT_81901 [Mycena rosella]